MNIKLVILFNLYLVTHGAEKFWITNHLSEPIVLHYAQASLAQSFYLSPGQSLYIAQEQLDNLVPVYISNVMYLAQTVGYLQFEYGSVWPQINQINTIKLYKVIDYFGREIYQCNIFWNSSTVDLGQPKPLPFVYWPLKQDPHIILKNTNRLGAAIEYVMSEKMKGTKRDRCLSDEYTMIVDDVADTSDIESPPVKKSRFDSIIDFSYQEYCL